MNSINYNFTYPIIGISYGWWCNRCWTIHFYPEDCPFDEMGLGEEEEYYYAIR